MYAHTLTSENMDLLVVGYMDQTRSQDEINNFFMLEMFEIWRFLFKFYESSYKYLRDFTYALCP